jgi:hypothetical protein
MGLHPNFILSQDSQAKSLGIPKIGILSILEGHNFMCIPLIEVKGKFVAIFEIFPKICAAPPLHTYFRVIINF